MTPEEFTSLYLPLGDTLYRAAFKWLGSQQEAEDAVQDLFVKLWNTRDSLESIRSPQAWSLTLLRNLCIDRIRSGGGAKRQAVPDELADETPPEPPEGLDQTLAVVRQLPPDKRALLRMRLVENLSYEEMSRRTGLTKVALRVAFHRLKNELKRTI